MKETIKQEDLSLEKILGRLRDEYWQSITEAESAEKKEQVELFTFWLGGEKYGVDLPLTRHLLKIPKIVRLPQVPDYILGVFNLRGEIMPVLDLRKLFAMKAESAGENARLLVVEAKGVAIALFLDKIGDIIYGDLKSLQSIGGEETGIPAKFLKGYFLTEAADAKMTIYLDLEQLLGSEKLVSFAG